MPSVPRLGDAPTTWGPGRGALGRAPGTYEVGTKEVLGARKEVLGFLWILENLQGFYRDFLPGFLILIWILCISIWISISIWIWLDLDLDLVCF